MYCVVLSHGNCQKRQLTDCRHSRCGYRKTGTDKGNGKTTFHENNIAKKDEMERTYAQKDGLLDSVLEGRTLKMKRRRKSRTKMLDDHMEKPRSKRRNDKRNQILHITLVLLILKRWRREG